MYVFVSNCATYTPVPRLPGSVDDVSSADMLVIVGESVVTVVVIGPAVQTDKNP